MDIKLPTKIKSWGRTKDVTHNTIGLLKKQKQLTPVPL